MAFVFSFSLFLIWLTVFLPDFEQKQTEKEIAEKVKSPTTNFIEVLANSFVEMKDNIDEVRNKIRDISSSTTYYTSSTTLQMHEEISGASSTEKME